MSLQDDVYDVKKAVFQHNMFFLSQKTKSVAFRIDALKKLYDSVKNYEQKIYEALCKDLNKPQFEAYESEIGIVLEEIRLHIKRVKQWAKPQKVRTSLLNFPASGRIYSEPLGIALIIAPWNYPFQLQILPLIGAISAGNCAILKPSECAPATSQVIYDMINETFEPDYISVFQGGKEITQALLKEPSDYIFFTGSPALGKVIMAAAAEHLTPVTLELGGKSPCIVDKSAKVELAAKRIVWGKFLNAGQTCVAPDYLYVHKDIKEQLLEEMKKCVLAFYGENPKESPDYARIINERHFDRLMALLEGKEAFVGGDSDRDEKYIAPTILDNISPDDLVMREEIFGPILPVMTFDNLYKVIDYVNENPKPLALYYFSENKEKQQEVIGKATYGGGCINEVILHLSNSTMPFGGVGNSGLGSYHGKFSFDAFSHKKPIMFKSTKLDFSARYAPYKGKLAMIKRLIK